MKKILIACLKPLSFLPAICMMLLIYSFSSQTGTASSGLSEQVSRKIVITADRILDKNWDEPRIQYHTERIHTLVRKAAHMTEYCILAICISFPFYVYGLRGFRLLLTAGLICVIFAASDEYHQSFVKGRGPSVRDVCIDSIGACFGITFVRIFCYFFLKKHTPQKKKRRARR